MKLLSPVWLFMTPWTVAYQAPPSMGFSRQDTAVGCHFLLQGYFPVQGSNLGLPHCKADTLPSEPYGMGTCQLNLNKTGGKFISNFYLFMEIKRLIKLISMNKFLRSPLIWNNSRCFGEGKGTPLQYSCLENPMDGEAWWATVRGVAKSRTRLSDFACP